MPIEKLINDLRQQRALMMILVVGFVLRVINIDWGIPVFDELVGRYHPDEWKISIAAVKFPQYFWQNTDFRYPTFFHLANALLFQPFRLIFDGLLGAKPNELHVYSTLFARGISVLVGTASIYLCYRLGARLISHAAGLVAAALCCVSLYHVTDSGYGTNDVMTSFFLALLMLQLIGLYTDYTARIRYIFAGITFGLLIGTKYTGGAALIMIVMACGWVLRSLVNSGDSRSLRQAAQAVIVNYLIMGAVSIVAFIATTPTLLIKFRYFIDSLNALRTAQALTANRGTSLEIATETLLDYVTAYGFAIAGLFLVSALFLTLQSRMRGWQRYYLISGFVYILAYTLFLGASLKPRYLITIAPVIVTSIAGGWYIARAMRPRWVAVVADILLGVTLASSLAYTVMGVYSKNGDARTTAAHYIADNIAPGTTVGVSYDSEKYRNTHRWRHPIIDFDNSYVETDMLQYPEILVVSSYDIYHMADALPSPYLSADLVWDSAGPISWYQGDAPSPRIFAFYKELLANEGPYQRVTEFTRLQLAPVSFPSASIRIYRRADAGPLIH